MKGLKMGFLKELYTETYFTGKNRDGSSAGFGVEGYNEFMKGSIRSINKSILSRIDFKEKNVLEFGFGRGEVIKYAFEHNCLSYEGVDFAPAALIITKDYLMRHKIPVPILHCCDALDFMYKCTSDRIYDIVIMFDFIEHVPRIELNQLLTTLKKHLTKNSIIAINTPVHRVDNDVNQEGLNLINLVDTVDTTNINPNTKGMHTNLYTIPSLHKYMMNNGYIPITEAHFYYLSFDVNIPISKRDYQIRWKTAKEQGCSLLGEYKDDILEYSFIRKDEPEYIEFTEGDLCELTLLVNKNYHNTSFSERYHNGELLVHFRQNIKSCKTIFDIGGFIGVDSLLFSKYSDSNSIILCFEPNPWNANHIYCNLSHNAGYSDRIICYELAISDKCGKMEMLCPDFIDYEYSNKSQMINEAETDNTYESSRQIGSQICCVDVITLDEFSKTTGYIPDLIKLDIEGAEYQALIGAVKTIAKHHPLLYIEFHTIISAIKCIRLLKDLDYEINVIASEEDSYAIIACEYKKNNISHNLKSLYFDKYEIESLRLYNKSISNELKRLSAEIEICRETYKEQLFYYKLENEQQLLNIRDNYESKQQSIQNEYNHQIQLHQINFSRQLDETKKESDTRLQKVINEYESRLYIEKNEQAETFQAEIEAYKNSTSWRLTKPLRAIKQLLK